MTSPRATQILGWRELSWAVLSAAGAVLAYHACQIPEPARTALELAASICEAAPGQRARLIERYVAPQLYVETSEHGPETLSRDELARVLDELAGASRRPGCEIELHDWQLATSADGATWLDATLEWSDSQPSDLHARRRRVRALFRASSGTAGDGVVQRLERVSVGPLLRAEPEARP